MYNKKSKDRKIPANKSGRVIVGKNIKCLKGAGKKKLLILSLIIGLMIPINSCKKESISFSAQQIKEKSQKK
ncbi:MAG: hypothetical protein LBG80_12005 [Bacteroidales bacterium]|jgi:hypothetical protein|nr:hypothetical protein [Bacteroidales bacterium]